MKRTFATLSIALLVGGCVSENPRDAVRQSGYLTTVPPSTNFGPGNIVWKKQNRYAQPEDVSLAYICSPGSFTLPGEPVTALGESKNFGSEKDFSFSGEALQKLGLSASGQHVRNLTIKFSNVQYLEYPLDQLDGIEGSLGPRCRSILKKQKKKKNAHIVRAAFKADLEYSVSYKSTLQASVKLAVANEIKGAFGINISSNRGTAGRGLYYGVDIQPLY